MYDIYVYIPDWHVAVGNNLLKKVCDSWTHYEVLEKYKQSQVNSLITWVLFIDIHIYPDRGKYLPYICLVKTTWKADIKRTTG